MTHNLSPYALFIRGPGAAIFDLADELGFESKMEALAVSIFEDGPSTMHLQALFKTQVQADASLKHLNLPDDIEAFVTQLPDEDWVRKSQQGLPPVKAGRFWVYGSHDADQLPDDIPWAVKIDAGLAFGTGHHGTTKGCLLVFDELLKNGYMPERILDLGCGAGILAIAAAKALGRTVLATDIDPDAVTVTTENAKINSVPDMVESVIADGFDSPALQNRQFDLIFANIMAGPLMGLAPDIKKTLAPGGHVILSGILDEQTDRVSKAFEKAGIMITPQPSLAGWTSLLGKNKT